MKRTTLTDYLAIDGNSQNGLAKRLGITQGAIWQMLKNRREIWVVEHDDGAVELHETRRVAPKDGAAA